eukprot:scaffold1438_cov126-Isochrysis_galbana.AAC.3
MHTFVESRSSFIACSSADVPCASDIASTSASAAPADRVRQSCGPLETAKRSMVRDPPAGTAMLPSMLLHAQLHAEAGGPAAASSRLQSLTERLWPVGRVGVQREACRG